MRPDRSHAIGLSGHAAVPGIRGLGQRYYAWRKRPTSPRAKGNARLEAGIAAAHERTRRTYGPERLQQDLIDHDVRVGVHRIKRIRKGQMRDGDVAATAADQFYTLAT
jgi:hypothetical protein